MKEEEGGGDEKNNDTNVSLRFYIIIHQYINTQSHLLHTHSLLLSLSLSIHAHTHYTPHTQHTLTQSKSGRHELIRFLEVEEIGFQSRLEGVNSCSISNMQWQQLLDRKTCTSQISVGNCA